MIRWLDSDKVSYSEMVQLEFNVMEARVNGGKNTKVEVKVKYGIQGKIFQTSETKITGRGVKKVKVYIVEVGDNWVHSTLVCGYVWSLDT